MRLSKIDLTPGIENQPITNDNGSSSQIIPLPHIVDCQWSPLACADTWNNKHCAADTDFYLPVLENDLINIQTQFLDYQNISPNFSCPPPTSYNHAVAEVEFNNRDTVVWGDERICIFYQLSLTFLGCLDVGDRLQTRTCTYPTFDTWVSGVIEYYENTGVVGGGVVTKVAANRMRIVWDIDRFKELFGRDICTEEILHCFYSISPFPGPELNNSSTVPEVTTTLAIQCCAPSPQCVTIAQGEDGGCSIPEGKMSFKFTIQPSPDYVFGTVAQTSAGVSDAAVALVKTSQIICPIESLLHPLQKFSNATDFSNYIDNYCDYLTNHFCTPSDIVTCNNLTGEFTILFDSASHSPSWDICKDKLWLCAPYFAIPNKGGKCDFTGSFKRILILPQTPLVLDPPPTTFSLYDSTNNFLWSASGLDDSSWSSYVDSIIAAFSIDFPNSYALIDGPYLLFNISLTDSPDVCKGTSWSVSPGTVLNQSMCCDKVCLYNAMDEYSIPQPFPNIGGFPSGTTNFRIIFSYSCNGSPFTPLGTYISFTATGYTDFMDNVLRILNSPGILTSRAYSDTDKWRSSYDRLWLPSSLFPCPCEEIVIYSLAQKKVGPIWSVATFSYHTLECCQSDCFVPPDYVEFSWTVKDTGINWGTTSFYSFINIIPQNEPCGAYLVASQPYAVRTSEVNSFSEYITLSQRRLMDLFDDTFSGSPTRTSVQVKKVGTDYEFSMRTYRYHRTLGDLCNGLKVCVGNNSGSGSGFKCFASFRVRFLTLDSYILEDGKYKFSYNLKLTCNGTTGTTQVYTDTIAFDLYSLPTLDDVFNAFVNKLTMKGYTPYILPSPPSAPYMLTFTVSEDIFPCRCDNQSYYVGQQLTITPDTGTDHYGKTSQIIINNGEMHAPTSGGDGVKLIVENPTFVADCCHLCINPFGYFSQSFEIEPSANDITIKMTKEYGCTEDVIHYYTTHPALSAEELAAKINVDHFPDLYAEGYGKIITIFAKNPLDCACVTESGESAVTIEVNGVPPVIRRPPDCCAGSGMVGKEQTPIMEITEQKCCPDFVTSVELVDCCCNKYEGYDVRTALIGHVFGQNSNPLMFFQNYQFDPSLIPYDCFAFKITGATGEVHYTDCYKKETCKDTVLLCSDYAEGKRDCLGYVYGLPEFGCPAVLEPVYTNCTRFPASVQITSYNFTYSEDNRKTSQKVYTLRTHLLPPYMVDKLSAILGGDNITVNGDPVTFTGTITKEREAGDMWLVSLELLGEECEIKSGSSCE